MRNILDLLRYIHVHCTCCVCAAQMSARQGITSVMKGGNTGKARDSHSVRIFWNLCIYIHTPCDWVKLVFASCAFFLCFVHLFCIFLVQEAALFSHAFLWQLWKRFKACCCFCFAPIAQHSENFICYIGTLDCLVRSEKMKKKTLLHASFAIQKPGFWGDWFYCQLSVQTNQASKDTRCFVVWCGPKYTFWHWNLQQEGKQQCSGKCKIFL